MKLKQKLMAAAIALVAASGANAAIQNAATNAGGLTPHQSEGVFTAYGNGFAYTFDLGQAGFNSLFGTDTKLNNLVTSTDTVLTSSSTIQALQQPANGIIFDMALPSFNSFLTSAGTSGIQFNVAFGDSIGTDRWLTTLQSPLGTTAGGMTAFDGIGAAFNTYVGAVSTKMTATPARFSHQNDSIEIQPEGIVVSRSTLLGLRGVEDGAGKMWIAQTVNDYFVPWSDLSEWEVHTDSDGPNFYRLILRTKGHILIRRFHPAEGCEADLLDAVRHVGKLPIRLLCDLDDL